MARPKRNTVDYFPHSVKHQKTMYILEEKYGNDGYAFWFKLLELLGDTDGHYLDLSNKMNWKYLTAKTKLAEEKCREILDLLAELDAIDPELWKKEGVWSQNFVNNFIDLYKKRVSDLPRRPD